MDQEQLNIFEGYSLADETEGLFQITPNEYAADRDANVRGAANPSLIDKPFWKNMVRSGRGGFGARMSFDDPEDPFADGRPVWCFERYGATRTKLPDGRIVCIGGEHEDSYDPDFCIYNGKNSSSTQQIVVLILPSCFQYYEIRSFLVIDMRMADVLVIAPPQPQGPPPPLTPNCIQIYGYVTCLILKRALPRFFLVVLKSPVANQQRSSHQQTSILPLIFETQELERNLFSSLAVLATSMPFPVNTRMSIGST